MHLQIEAPILDACLGECMGRSKSAHTSRTSRVTAVHCGCLTCLRSSIKWYAVLHYNFSSLFLTHIPKWSWMVLSTWAVWSLSGVSCSCLWEHTLECFWSLLGLVVLISSLSVHISTKVDTRCNSFNGHLFLSFLLHEVGLCLDFDEVSQFELYSYTAVQRWRLSYVDFAPGTFKNNDLYVALHDTALFSYF